MSYNLPERWLKKAFISGMSINAQIQNIWWWGSQKRRLNPGILERDFSDIYFEKRARPDHIYARFIFKILKGDDYEKNIFMDCLGHVPLSGV